MGVPLAEDVRIEGASETRKISESGLWGSLGLGTRGGLGNSETRNLCDPPDRTQKRGPRKRGNSETGIWGPLGSEPERGLGNLKNSESGICPGVSRNLHTRNLGIWNLRRSIFWNLLHVGICPRGNKEFGNWVPSAQTFRGALEYWKLGNSESGICRGVSWNLHTWKHEIWILGSLSGPTEGHRKLGNSESGFWVSVENLHTIGNMESGIWVSVLQGCPGLGGVSYRFWGGFPIRYVSCCILVAHYGAPIS